MEQVDNPGKWCQYTYQPKYSKGQYLGHFTLGGATVVPENENGERRCGGWQFYYDEYYANEEDLKNHVCAGANSENPLLDSRIGKLDIGCKAPKEAWSHN